MNKNIKKKYKMSILIDILIMMFLLLTVFLLMAIYGGQSVMDFYFIPFIVITTIYYFLSDKVFFNQSIGKKIMKIKIFNIDNKLPTLKQIILRRFLDLINYDLILFKAPYNVDEKTKTKIEIDNK